MSSTKSGKPERTQRAIRDEYWSDERIKSYFQFQPPAGITADYHVLLKAYQGMIAEAFGRFVHFFVAEGRDINATLPDGSTILDLISSHAKSQDYASILKLAGAQFQRDL